MGDFVAAAREFKDTATHLSLLMSEGTSRFPELHFRVE